MTSLAGLEEQLDILQSHWTRVQQSSRQLSGRHQPSNIGDSHPDVQHFPPVDHAAGSSSRPRTLQGSNAHRLNQRSNPAKLAADQHQPPECFITPANSVTKKLPQLLPQGALRLPHIQSHTSHASPRTRAEARNPKSKHSHADNAENHSLGQLQSPASVPSGGRTAQQRRKQKRPQWQDVSIDLSAMQDAQEQAGPLMNHADRPIGPIPSTETARAVHMSGVSPASPSPPKQHPQNMPLASHKSHSSVPTLPALALPGACPAPALAAWHENIELNQPRQHSQQYPHQLSQSVGTARDTLPMPSRTSQQPQSRQLPNCLPPLHHQPLRRAGHPAPSSADCASSQSLYGTQISKYQLTPFPCDREGQHTDPLSSSHHALQTYNDAVPSTWYRRAEGPDGFASDPSRQVASEDPRTAQQVPMQYLRHPCGSGAPGGLHRLHRPLRPLARSQHQPANSFLDGGASTSAGVGLTSAGAGTTSACATSTLTEAPLQSLQQEAAASAAPDSMRHPWQSQTSHHEQHRPASGRQSQPVVVQQQPTFPVPAVPNCGWQPYNVTEQQPQQEGMPVRIPCHDIGSSAGQAAEDVQDVHKRLQQVRSCLRNGRQDSPQEEDIQGPCTGRGRRAVGDGGFAGMRLSQVMPARPPAGPRRQSDTRSHASAAEQHPEGAGQRLPTGSSMNRHLAEVDPWQGQGLDEVLRPVPHTRPPQPSRQRPQALQGSSGAVHNTYAGYIQQLQQSGASTSNRLALHAGRRNTGSEAVEALLTHSTFPSTAPQPSARRVHQAPSPNIMSLLRRVTYTERGSLLRPTNRLVSKESGDAQTECSICLENFAMPEQLRRVACGHLFHPRCIQEWFATGDSRCPMCRFDPVTKCWPS